MNTYTSPQIHIPSACIDVKADQNGVTLGVQANGSVLVDLHMTDVPAIDALIVALVNGKHHYVAARGDKA